MQRSIKGQVMPRSIVKALVNRTLDAAGFELVRTRAAEQSYRGDGITLFGRNLSFLRDPKFMAAYARGENSGHIYDVAPGKGLGAEFRTYVECWAARECLRLDGDFVCCGVNTGVIPLAICEYLDFNESEKTFWLFDTYNGVPESQMSDIEREGDRPSIVARLYQECFATAQKNFAPFHRARLVRGTVPDTLNKVDIPKVAYLSIDMNIAYPEIKAIEHFWPKLSAGAIVILDDYAFSLHEERHDAMDSFAQSVGVRILTMPTGQGLLIKPQK